MPTELLDRRGMVVHAQVGDGIRRAHVAPVLADDEQRGGLLAAPVASGGLCRRERLEQALGKRLPAVSSK